MLLHSGDGEAGEDAHGEAPAKKYTYYKYAPRKDCTRKSQNGASFGEAEEDAQGAMIIMIIMSKQKTQQS